MTEEQKEEALRMLRRLCVGISDVTSRSYLRVADKYGMKPDDLRLVLTVYKKEKNRTYMREYMRRRRGGLKRV